jgi:hypothetical protein
VAKIGDGRAHTTGAGGSATDGDKLVGLEGGVRWRKGHTVQHRLTGKVFLLPLFRFNWASTFIC